MTPQSTSTSRVLIVLTSHSELGQTGKPTGFYLSEVSHPHAVFREAGFDVEFASPKGGKPPMDGVDREDPINVAFLADEKVMAQVATTIPASEVKPERYQAIFYAGGHGTMWDFPNNQDLQRITRHIDANKGVIAAVCHGPAGLVNVTKEDGTALLKGARVTGFTNEEESAVSLTDVVPFLLEDKMKAQGATFEGAPKFTAHVVTSGRIVTGQNPASATGTAQAVVRLLQAKSAE